MADADPVEGPVHYLYNTDGSRRKFEPADVIDDWGLAEDHYLANAVEYIARSQSKNAFLEDLGKALWNLKRRIRNEERRVQDFQNRPMLDDDEE